MQNMLIIVTMVAFSDIILLWAALCLPEYAQGTNVTAWQVPNLTVTQNTNASITCHFCAPEIHFNNIWSGYVQWEKQNKPYLTEEKKYINQSNNSRVLPLYSLQLNDSGWYRCNVFFIIPKLLNVSANGTYLTVVDEPEILPVNVGLWLSVGGVLVVLLIGGIALVFRRFKRDDQHKEERTENVPQDVLLESASQDTEEITYASINKQSFNCRENKQKIPEQERMANRTNGPDSTVEESVLYSPIRIKTR
ncbi:uncharacterized protein si:dkey-63d15.12 isoform X1 [Alosa sapidissima]|uniref:uncharacterized protein si:dkey-63d15.12 isoform X1 n=1 Tax=Alosa sapidissima TaxID=34773 RepID=UPI001C08D63C|nr:uncharacterized protein si:dkey-63d15.12 isoform X1 [Alosa sapidissima]